MAKIQREYHIQKQVCQYLSLQYPDVIFLSDTVASVKLTAPQSIRNKSIQKDNFQIPDLIVLEPKGKYHGLLIELKVKRINYKNQPDKLMKNDHIQGQLESINKLMSKGYFASFAVGFDEAKKIIDDYMSL